VAACPVTTSTPNDQSSADEPATVTVTVIDALVVTVPSQTPAATPFAFTPAAIADAHVTEPPVFAGFCIWLVCGPSEFSYSTTSNEPAGGVNEAVVSVVTGAVV
jgi:hypothetical protein